MVSSGLKGGAAGTPATAAACSHSWVARLPESAIRVLVCPLVLILKRSRVSYSLAIVLSIHSWSCPVTLKLPAVT